eukprot:GEMP01003808.1.p1 GENE.GEMP01003808.1~~GEMP01003808.1.p1  ORF type:complete len:841 (+),score=121.02 GEMP01003808.1:20-2542(+)
MSTKRLLVDKLMERYSSYTGKILVFWVVLTSVSAFFAVDLFGHTTEGVLAPLDSPSAEANALRRRYFPTSYMTDSVLISIEGPPGTDFRQNATVFRAMERDANVYWTRSHIGTVEIVGYDSIMSISPALEKWAKTQLFSLSGRAGRLIFAHLGNSERAVDFGASCVEFANRMNARYPGYDVGAMGVSVLLHQTMGAAKHDVEHVDVFVLPIAFFVFALVVRSWRLVLIPIVHLVATAATSFAVMDFVTHYLTEVTSITPTFMLSLATALTIDYALFLQSRFTEELRGMKRKEEQKEWPMFPEGTMMPLTEWEPDIRSVKQALTTSETSGKTIAASGCTLMLGFISLIFFPSGIRSLGIGALVTVFITIVANLSLGPCLMLYFPNFFSKKACCGTPGQYIAERMARLRERKLRCFEGEIWYIWARFTTKRCTSLFVIVALIIIALVCMPLLASMKLSAALDSMIPHGGASAHALHIMTQYFGAALLPYTVLFIPKGGDVFEYNAWHEMDARFQLANSIMPRSVLNRLEGPLVPLCSSLSSEGQRKLLRECFHDPAQCTSRVQWFFYDYPKEKQEEIAAFVPLMLKQYVSSAGRALSMTLQSGTMASGSASDLAHARRLRETVISGAYTDIHIVGLDMIDSMDAIYNSLPVVGGATIIIVLVVIGALYRSVMIPLRGVITISFTMLITFTTLVGVDQYSWLGGPSGDGIYFIVPPLAFSLILGLSLDYDVFLLGRIVDARMEGYDAISSIQFGVWRTGKIITSVGVIMTIAFIGTAVSTIPMLSQLGLLLCVAVMVDTFLVRPLITPALMALFGEKNWWPRAVPVVHRSIHETESFLADVEY